MVENEWHEHDGQAWPEHANPEDYVEVEFRDGMRSRILVNVAWSEHDDANLWHHTGGTSDITRYRVIPNVA